MNRIYIIFILKIIIAITFNIIRPLVIIAIIPFIGAQGSLPDGGILHQ